MFARGRQRPLLQIAVALALASCAPSARPQLQETVNLPIERPLAGLPERSGETVTFSIRDAASLRKEYGNPDFVRTEAESELWRYDGANCALFLFLYRERETLQLRHMETLPRGSNSATDEACLASVKTRVLNAS